MARLIDELMDVSRIDQGRFELKRERVTLANVVQVAIETSRPLIEQLGHELTVKLPAEPVTLDADLTRLVQAVLNLLNNAAKFSPKGGHISLAVRRDGREVVVSVKDDGIGIQADQLDAVFELFSQIKNPLSPTHGGLGIGLCLVKKVVEMHGGQVQARSPGLGQGSEFLIRLPVAEVPAPAETPPSPAADEMLASTDLRILVVDDNADIASTLATLLLRMGNSVRTAHDGIEGLQVARDFRPHVVVLDIGLPGMNGLDTARALRQEPWGKDVILIAATGWGQTHDIDEARRAGFDRHLVKPVNPRTLMALLAELHVDQHDGNQIETGSLP